MFGRALLMKCAESIFASAKAATTERNVRPTGISHGT